MKKNTWITKNKTTLISCPAFNIIQKDCVSSENAERLHKFYQFESKDWCNVIPITSDGKMILVKQFRVGIEDFTLEFPGGIVEDHEKDIGLAAQREMCEETGYEPLPENHQRYLGWVYANPAINNNKCHLYAVGPVSKVKSQDLDLGEMVEVVEISMEELPKLIIEGKFKNPMMLSSVLFLLLQGQKNNEINNLIINELKAFKK
jgi:ADP-ribose pyrophosphatase